MDNKKNLLKIAIAYNEYINKLSAELKQMEAVTISDLLKDYRPLATAARAEMEAISALLIAEGLKHKINYSTLIIEF